MAMIRCEANEHYYDNSKHSSCPFCGRVSSNDGKRASTDKTVLVEPKRTSSDKTELVSQNEENKTVIVRNSSTKEKQMDNNMGEKTIAPWQRKKSSQSSETKNDIDESFSEAPVVGWLVIVEGASMGKDFRIVPGINTIGRGMENMITINNGDNEISREKHCIVEFDVKNSKFYLERGTTTTYLNENRVGGEGSEMDAGDIIEIGKTKLKFIPFCSSDYCWEM